LKYCTNKGGCFCANCGCISGYAGGIMWTADGWPEGWRVRWRCVCWLLIWNVDGIAEQRKPRLLFD
jgi:hypothetical protein